MIYPTITLTEIGLFARAFIADLTRIIEQGVALFIDYGFPRRELYHPQRRAGTLMCHYRHRAHADPFFLPGLQDITAHVDFTAVADTATLAGAEILGYTTQASFLIDCGLTDELSADFARGRRRTICRSRPRRTSSRVRAKWESFSKSSRSGRGVPELPVGFRAGRPAASSQFKWNEGLGWEGKGPTPSLALRSSPS